MILIPFFLKLIFCVITLLMTVERISGYFSLHVKLGTVVNNVAKDVYDNVDIRGLCVSSLAIRSQYHETSALED